MLYDSYQKKILRVLDVLRKIFKHIVLISIVSVLVIAAIVAFMVTKGIVIDDEAVADSFEMTYGDDIPLNSKALFAKVTYEYSTNGNDWSVELPKSLGEYTVRATAKTLFGQTKYGKSYSFVLKARDASVSVIDKAIVYGDTPKVSSELAFEDKIICEKFDYANRLSTVTSITPIKEVIKIISADGEDVTSSYNIIPETSLITINPRSIFVTVSDKELIYNDTKLSYDGYELSAGTLADGDTLQAVFNKYLIDVGEVENTPELSVVAYDGLDVSVHYNISAQIGTLKVDYRPLIIETGSAEKVYDDNVLSNNNYEVIGEYDIVDGHIVVCESSTSIIDVDEVENALVLSIKNAEGEDKTSNYSLFYERGTLKVTPRPVTISTLSGEWVYDNQEHYTDAPDISGICPNQHISAETSSIIDAGTVENMVTIKSIRTANGRDVLANYELIYENIGTLTVTKRPITIVNENSPANLVYDGTERMFTNYKITEGSLATNENLELIFPSFSQAGRYENENKIIDSVLYSKRANGIKRLELSDNYEVTEIYGTIDIAKYKLEIQVLDVTKEYDGLEFVTEEYEEKINGGIPNGHSLNIVYKPTGVNVGEYEAEVDLEKTTITYGGADATKNFEISARNGKLRIVPRNITLQPNNIQKVYDGVDISSTEFTVVSGSLVEGHQITNVEFILIEDNSVSDDNVIGKWISVIDKDKLTILDSNNEDITANYNVTCLEGTLQILLRKLSVISNSETKIYNREEIKGTEVIVDSISNINDGLLEGHTLTYILPVSAVNAGSYENEIVDLDIIDNSGKSVKMYYDVTVNFGILEILPIDITVTTESDEKIYNGTPLTCPKYTSDDSKTMLEGDSISIRVIGTITDAGEALNDIEYNVYDANGKDITALGNYKVNCNYGTLTVNRRVIKIKPLPERTEKLYDGTPLECINYQDVSNLAADEGLIGNHEIIELHFTSITDAGTIKIDIDTENAPIIVSGESYVRKNYEIVIDGEETLTVTKRNIIIVSDSAEKKYDGRPLRAPGCTWSSESEHTLLDGHTIELFASGVQIDEGSSNNSINRDAKIIDANGNNVALNYDISYVEGTLTVYKDVVAKVTSSKDGKIYLKVKSFGDYNGKGFDTAPNATNYFNYRQNYQCSYMLWSSVVLLRNGYSENTLTVKDATTYMLPYYMTFGGDYTLPLYNSEDYSSLSSDKSYTVPYYDYSYEKNGTSGLSRYTPSQSSAYTSWVKANYLDIPNDTKKALLSLVEEYNFANLSKESKINSIAGYIRGSAIYNTNYDILLDYETDVAVKFLEKYKEGSAKHFAIAATMLYRAFDIPARYVEGYVVNAKANEEVEVKDAHYWVEVFVDNYGWMQIELVGSEMQKIDITIKPKDETKVYDGEPLTATAVERYQFTDELNELFDANGFKIVATFKGSRTDAGESESEIVTAQIYDANGNNITYLFNIHKEKGSLKVTPSGIDVLLSTIKKTYDAKPAEYGDEKFYSVRDEAFKKTGYTLTISATFQEVDVHKLTAAMINKDINKYISLTVMNGEQNLSHNYYVNLVSYSDKVSLDDYVIVEIKPKSIEITSASQTKLYSEGAKLINNKVTVTLGELVENQKLLAVANGVLDQIGSIPNPINPETVVILDANGDDVTYNYVITIKYGTLTFLEDSD